jgi:hypothetical protein
VDILAEEIENVKEDKPLVAAPVTVGACNHVVHRFCLKFVLVAPFLCKLLSLCGQQFILLSFLLLLLLSQELNEINPTRIQFPLEYNRKP